MSHFGIINYVSLYHSPPSSTDVNNEWSYTSNSTICLYGVCRDDLTFPWVPGFFTARKASVAWCCPPWGLPTLLHNGYRGPFPELKRPGSGVTTQPQLAPFLQMSRAIPLLLLYAFMAYYRVTLPFYQERNVTDHN